MGGREMEGRGRGYVDLLATALEIEIRLGVMGDGYMVVL